LHAVYFRGYKLDNQSSRLKQAPHTRPDEKAAEFLQLFHGDDRLIERVSVVGVEIGDKLALVSESLQPPPPLPR